MQSLYQSVFHISTGALLRVDTKLRMLKFVAVAGSLLTLVSLASRYYTIQQLELHFVANVIALAIVYLLAKFRKAETASWVLCITAWISIVASGYDSIAVFYGSVTAHVTLLLGVIWLISGRAMPWFLAASTGYIWYEAIFGKFALAISGSRASAIANGIGQFIFLLIGVMAISLVSGVMNRQYNRQLDAAADLEKLNDALRDSESRYRLMVDNSAESIFILDLDGWKIIDANQNACETFGYSRKQLLSMTTTDLLSAELRAQINSIGPFNISEKLRRGEETTVELEHITANGKPFMGEVRLVPLGGHSTLVRTSIVDITERKADETALQESWAHLRMMMDALPANISYLNTDLCFTYGNEGFIDAFHFDPANDPKSIKSVMGSENFAHREPFLRQALAGETVGFEFQFHYPDRPAISTLNVTYAPHIVDDTVEGIFLIAVDVTATRSAEQALSKTTHILHAILDNHPSKITYVDTDRRAQFVSKQYAELGIEPSQVIGKNPIELMPDSYRKAISPHIIQAMQTRTRVKADILYTCQNGEDAIDAYEIIPHMIDGELQGVISLSNNITSQRKTQQALEQSQRAESLGVLAGGIAHDFNNLLSAILSQNSIALYKMADDHPARRHIDKSVGASKRAATLTQQMLAYSGRGQFEVREIDLNDLISQNLSLFELSIPAKVQILVTLEESLPKVKVDIAQIQQVIMNLIINAAQAIGENDGVIEVTTTQQPLAEFETLEWSHSAESLEPGDYLRLDVRDNGCGMDADTLNSIFDPFFTTKITGTGLGLAAVLGIVHSHQGGLDVVSKLGVGTTFSILLPMMNKHTIAVGDVELMAG